MALIIRKKEAKAHALIVATIGWSFAVSSGVIGPGNRSVFGQMKWSDFIQFYTMGDIARSGPAHLLYDDSARHARQVSLAPQSDDQLFLSVYGPQTAILFATISRLPYVLGGLVWVVLSVSVYLWCVRAAWKPARDALNDGFFVLAAALAFPPAWQLAAYGQTTAIPVLAFTAGWLAVERGSRFLGGMALGLLAVKPQLGLVLAPVAIITAEWQLVSGVVASVMAQAALVWIWFGASIFADYLEALRRIPGSYALLEPAMYKMHSIATLTELLPGGAGPAIWATASVFTVAAVVLVWRSVPEWRVRFAVLVLASVLVSPHVAIYDLALLALPALWLGGWFLETLGESDWYWQRLYWLAAATLVPTAAFLKIQASVVIMIELFVRIVIEVVSYARIARTAAPSGTSRDPARRRAVSW